jgi:hypothetical protein
MKLKQDIETTPEELIGGFSDILSMLRDQEKELRDFEKAVDLYLSERYEETKKGLSKILKNTKCDDYWNDWLDDDFLEHDPDKARDFIENIREYCLSFIKKEAAKL